GQGHRSFLWLRICPDSNRPRVTAGANPRPPRRGKPRMAASGTARTQMGNRTSHSKVVADAHTALADLVADGQTLAVGGFGLCGIPEALIGALRDSGVRDLTVISNNAGVD